MKKLYKYLPFALVLSLIVYFTIEAYATSTGRAQRTSTVDGGCGGTGCHGTSSSSATSLSITSGSLTVDPGSTNSFTIRVANSSLHKAGINIAVKTTITGNSNIGELGAPVGSGLQTLISELTHSTPKDFSGGNADFNFTWKAPDKPGHYYLRAAGLAANTDDQGVTSDQWNWMTPADLIVRGVELSEPKAGDSFCTGSNLTIKWISAGIEDLKIELSSDGGANWGYVISNSFKAVGGIFIWSVPADFQQGKNFRIRLSDVTNPSRKSEMTSNFGIYGQFTVSKHPDSKELCPGESHTLYVNTTGTGLTYQWRRNGALIPNATDSVLVLTNVNSGNTGFYGVIVSSSCFSPIISNEANVQVRIPTVINKQPENQNVCPGDSAKFILDADGHAIKYQWFKGNMKIDGATSTNLIIPYVTQNDVASYTCEITGFCGFVKSNAVTIALNTAPKITKQPVSQTVCEKTNVELSIEASGLDNLYEWFFNGKKVSTGANAKLSLTNVNYTNSGTYYCIVSNNCGEPLKSNEVQLTVNPLPQITLQPQSKIVMVGDLVEFTITAKDAVSYQWRKNNQNITDATEPTLVIESAKIIDAGDYDCVVTNNCGKLNTNKAKLTVNEPEPGPRISYSSSVIDFGDVFEEKSIDSTVVGFFTNIGDTTLLIDSIRLVTTDTIPYFEFEFTDSTEVGVGESVGIFVKFTPFTVGKKTAKLKIFSNAIGVVPDVELAGDGAFWDVVSNRSKVDLGSINVGATNSVSFRIFNQSDYDVTWIGNEFECDNSDNSPYNVSSPELPVNIKSKTSQDVEVTFAPYKDGNLNCFISFEFWGTEKNLKVQLTGIGTGMSVNSDLMIPKFNVFPNPSSQNLTFEFSVIESFDYTLEIVDNQGIIVRHHSDLVRNENEIYTWDVKDNNGNNLPSGSYTVILRAGNAVKTLNIVLVK